MRDREYLRIYLRADPSKHFYKRSTDGLLALIGDIGGISEMVMALGAALVSPFIVHFMNSQLVKEVYQVQQYSKETADLKLDKEVEED